ncbi:MAG: antibiotic biosynthesis monooxygenase [Dehalococcoidia bacterium]|nr:antibiotic biosynthesis monooxygenase [Dehalococcoidia bacterium]
MYAVTNHLFPKPEFWLDFVDGFAGDSRPPITEKWNATRFEMRRPIAGNEWVSTSIWANTEAFDAWRGSEDIRASHSNVRYEMYSQRAKLSFHDVVMNSEPGRAPVLNQPERYREMGVGLFVVTHMIYPKADRHDDVLQAYAAIPTPTDLGWVWWDLWKNLRSDEWWSISYFRDRDAYEAAKAANFPYLGDAGDPDWYSKPSADMLAIVELERVPGMSRMGRRAWEPASV